MPGPFVGTGARAESKTNKVPVLRGLTAQGGGESTVSQSINGSCEVL